MAKIVGMDLTGTKSLQIGDLVTVQVGRGIGKRAEIKEYLDGKIYAEPLNGDDMIETKARFVLFVERPAQVMTQ